MKLSQLPINTKAKIIKLDLPEAIKARLQPVGFRVGCDIECVRKAPLADPSEYLIEGSLIALRRFVTSKIEVVIEK